MSGLFGFEVAPDRPEGVPDRYQYCFSCVDWVEPVETEEPEYEEYQGVPVIARWVEVNICPIHREHTRNAVSISSEIADPIPF